MSNLPPSMINRSPAPAGVLAVKSVEKAFLVLQAFTNRERLLSLGKIAEITSLDKSAVQRLTRTLIGLGYLEQDPTTRHYLIGRRVLDLGFEYLRSNTLIERAAPILVELRQLVRERVDLTLPDGDDVLYVFRLQSKHEALHAALIGRRVPLYCSAGGRAIMSRLTSASIDVLIERADKQQITPHTLVEPKAIRAKVEEARREGYSLQAQEWRLGEIAVAAAIVDHDGVPVAAVHVAGSTQDWEPQEFGRRIGPLVATAAQDIRG